MVRRGSGLGWKLTLAVSGCLLVLFGLQLAIYGTGEEGIRVVVRASARTSLLLFVAAFTASSLKAFWLGTTTRWLVAHRRYIGVSYAVSHALHLIALVALHPVCEEFRGGLNAVTLGGGGLAYAFTFAMAFTSSNAAVAALGARRWKLLHAVGGWFIWGIFAQSYLLRAVQMPEYIPAGALVIAVAVVRLASRWRRTRPGVSFASAGPDAGA